MRHRSSFNLGLHVFVGLLLGCVVLSNAVNSTQITHIPFDTLPNLGSVGLVFGVRSFFLVNDTLPCFADEFPAGNFYWTGGGFAPYNPCGGASGTDRVIANDNFYLGDPAYVAAHPNAPQFNGYISLKNGTGVPWSYFVALGYPPIYVNIPMQPGANGDTPVGAFQGGAPDTNLEYYVWILNAVTRGMMVETIRYNTGDNSFPYIPTGPTTSDRHQLLRYSDMVQIHASNLKLANTAGDIWHHRLDFANVLVFGHSAGGANLLLLAADNARLGTTALPGVTAAVFMDGAFWSWFAADIELLDIPFLVIGSAQLDPVMTNRRAFGLAQGFEKFVVMLTNSVHQDWEWGLEAFSIVAQELDFGSNPGGQDTEYSYSWLDPNVWAIWPAYEDVTGRITPGDTVKLDPLLSLYTDTTHFLGAFIQWQMFGESVYALEFIPEVAQQYLGARGQYWAYASCGSVAWNAETTVPLLLGLEIDYVGFPPALIESALLGGNSRLDGTFNLSPTQQTSLQLLECLLDQSRDSEANYVQSKLNQLQSVRAHPHIQRLLASQLKPEKGIRADEFAAFNQRALNNYAALVQNLGKPEA